nr:formate/nitrite transporter family protein [uncultured Lichenicoccus sp.]
MTGKSDDQGDRKPRSKGEPALPNAKEIHDLVLEEGEAELERGFGSLAWSGLAAGLSMGFSFLVMSIMRGALPDRPWAILIDGSGYTVGFLIAVLGRQQLFTESTLTAVLPVLSRSSSGTIPKLLRLWAIVLAANLIGTIIFAWLICHQDLFKPQTWTALNEISTASLESGFWPMAVKSLLAGWLIALMVWLLPGAGPAQVLIIMILTYVVAIGQFSHMVAGSVEAAFAVFAGHASPFDYLGRFALPTLIGNTLGGVSLVAILNHAPLRFDAEV